MYKRQAESYGRDDTGITGTGQAASVFSGAEPEFKKLKQRKMCIRDRDLLFLISLVPESASEEWHQHSDRQYPDLLIFLSSCLLSGVFLFCLLSCPFSIAVKCYILLQR